MTNKADKLWELCTQSVEVENTLTFLSLGIQNLDSFVSPELYRKYTMEFADALNLVARVQGTLSTSLAEFYDEIKPILRDMDV